MKNNAKDRAPSEKEILSAYETYVVTNNKTNPDGSVNIASEDVRLAKKEVDDNKK